MLRRLRFVLLGAVQVRHQRHMDEQAVLPPDLQRDLAHGFDERLRFDVADRAADLGDHHVRVGLLSHAVDELLDLARDVGDHLHRRAEVFAAALLLQHVPVHLAGRQVGKAVEVLVDEPLVMSQIQIRFRTVLGHIHLAVLVRAHRTGVDVDVGIELLRRHLQSSGLEQPPQRGRCDPLAQSRHHTAGHEDIFGVFLSAAVVHPDRAPSSFYPKKEAKRPARSPVQDTFALTRIVYAPFCRSSREKSALFSRGPTARRPSARND